MEDAITIPGLEGLVPVGRGGFGTVYRAYQRAADRFVAVKIVDRIELDDATWRRFEREVAALGPVSSHPAIVSLYDSGVTSGGIPYLVMQFAGGGTLGDRLRGGPLEWKEAVDVGIRIAGALGAAHGSDCCHRDIKPDNILFDEFGQPLLADFGIASLGVSRITRTGSVVATVAYAAPDVLQGSRPDARSDVYSLGATLYHAMSGHPPFSVPGDTPASVLYRTINEEPPPLPVTVPPATAAVIWHALRKDPELRPPTAVAFAHDLQAAQSESGVPVTPLVLAGEPPATRSSADTGGAVDPELRATARCAPEPATTPLRTLPSPGPVEERPSTRRSRILTSVLVVIGVVTAASALWIGLSAQKDPPVPPATPGPAAISPVGAVDPAGSSPETTVATIALPAASAQKTGTEGVDAASCLATTADELTDEISGKCFLLGLLTDDDAVLAVPLDNARYMPQVVPSVDKLISQAHNTFGRFRGLLEGGSLETQACGPIRDDEGTLVKGCMWVFHKPGNLDGFRMYVRTVGGASSGCEVVCRYVDPYTLTFDQRIVVTDTPLS